MTDGGYLDTRGIRYASGPVVGTKEDPSQIDLTAFSQWIELQPVSTHVGLLESIANDFYRRRDYPTIAGELVQGRERGEGGR